MQIFPNVLRKLLMIWHLAKSGLRECLQDEVVFRVVKCVSIEILLV